MTEFVQYSKEINPLVREVIKRKQMLKDFKDTDEEYQDFVARIKAIQEEAKSYIETNDNSKELISDIKDAENDLKQALKSASKAIEIKPVKLKKYFVARVKDSMKDEQKDKKAVASVIDLGEVFEQLEGELE